MERFVITEMRRKRKMTAVAVIVQFILANRFPNETRVTNRGARKQAG